MCMCVSFKLLETLCDLEKSILKFVQNNRSDDVYLCARISLILSNISRIKYLNYVVGLSDLDSTTHSLCSQMLGILSKFKGDIGDVELKEETEKLSKLRFNLENISEIDRIISKILEEVRKRYNDDDF